MYSRASDDRKKDEHPERLPAAAGPAPTFSPGDRVMVPPYGIGRVCELAWKLVAGVPTAYYAIEFPQTSSRAFVPVRAPQGSGMRAALTSDDMPRLLGALQHSQLDLLPQWSARQRQVTEVLVSGDPFELATLTCELRRWNLSRGLPDLDRQAFRRAIKLLEQEVQGLEDEPAHQVRALLVQALGEGAQ